MPFWEGREYMIMGITTLIIIAGVALYAYYQRSRGQGYAGYVDSGVVKHVDVCHDSPCVPKNNPQEFCPRFCLTTDPDYARPGCRL